MGEPGSLREAILIKVIDRDYYSKYLETLLLSTAMLAANDKTQIGVFNKYLKQYESIVFGDKQSSAKETKEEDLYKDVNAYRKSVYSKTFKPKIGKKLTKDINNVNIIDLIKG